MGAYVHNCIGTEPSGRAFNEMVLKDFPSDDNANRGIPHNPCINAGAIMAVSMVYNDEPDSSKRLEKVLDFWRDLSGGPNAPIGYDDPTYRSESSCADRNRCLGYMMRERKSFPPTFNYDNDDDLHRTLELYFQICSITSTCKAMSIMAATLANGGLNPLSGVACASPEHVRCALPLMLTCGMYDFSGQWAYQVGIPAKSGVGGCVYMIVPNVCGIAVFSPRLDDIGNSARAVAVAQALVERVQFHNFEVFAGLNHRKMEPRTRKNAEKQAEIGELLYAASEGDVSALETFLHAGTNLFLGDYDDRTALHLAASEGHLGVVKFLISSLPADPQKREQALNHCDRWGGTPTGDAKAGGHADCEQALIAAGGKAGTNMHVDRDFHGDDITVAPEAPQVLFAAAEGDLDTIVRLCANGIDMCMADYDQRTGLHLAACNGHTQVVNYLFLQCMGDVKKMTPKDRFGNTPSDDAVRENHSDCSKVLEKFISMHGCPACGR